MERVSMSEEIIHKWSEEIIHKWVMDKKVKNLNDREEIEYIEKLLKEFKEAGCTHVCHEGDYLSGYTIRPKTKEEILEQLKKEVPFYEQQIIGTTKALEITKNRIQELEKQTNE
jgi:hypothetical protein